MRTIRTTALIGIVLAVLAATAAAASAHVTITDSAEKGGFSIVTFSVPNERPDAVTTSLRVQLPQDQPLVFVSVQPKPGWTVATTMRTLDAPVEAFGEQHGEVVDTVTWSGGEIEAGQFDTFSLSVGPLPEDTDELLFPTIQTYSDSEEVPWIEKATAGAEEPEHPAPALVLVEAEGGEGSHDSAGTTTTVAAAANSESASGSTTTTEPSSGNGLAIAALVVAGVAVVLAGAALAMGRKNPA